MSQFDVKHIPNGYLRGQWVCSTFLETRGLAHAFAHFARPLFASATPQEKFRLGITSDKTGRGKSTFIETLLRDLYPTQPSEEQIDEGFSLGISEEKKLFYYDQRRAKTLHRISRIPIINHFFGKEMRDQFKQLKVLTSIHVAEWPEYGWDRNYNALWRLKDSDLGIQWSLYCSPELTARDEFDTFVRATEPYEPG